MSREAERPKDQNRTQRERRRQQFYSIAREVLGPHTKEIYEKVTALGENPTSEAVFTAASQKAEKLFHVLVRGKDKARIDREIMNDLGEKAIRQQDPEAIREWGDRCAQINAAGELNAPMAKFYFVATQLGDDEASHKLHRLLSKEKERARTAISLGFYETTGILHEVVDHCVADDLPADIWINTYAVNETHANALKLRYYQKAQQRATDNSFAEEYGTEVTEHILRGETYTAGFVWTYHENLYNAQTDPEKKKELIEYLQSVDEEIPLTRLTWKKFFSFAKLALTDGEVANINDIFWIERCAENLAQQALERGIAEPVEVKKERNTLQATIAYALDATPEQLIRLIDGQSTDFLQMDPPPSENTVVTSHDDILEYLLKRYAAKGEYTNANLCFSAMIQDTFQERAFKQVLDHISNPEDLVLLTPDEVSLIFDNRVKESFEAKEILLRQDPDEIASLALRLSGEIKPDLSTPPKEFLLECINNIYRIDPEQGNELVAKVIATIKQQSPQAKFIIELASLQLAHDDNHGWSHLLRQGTLIDDPIEQLKHYAMIAAKAARKREQEATPHDDH